MRYSFILVLLCLSWARGQNITDEERKRFEVLFGTDATDDRDADVDLSPGKVPSTPSRGPEISPAERERLEALYGKPDTTNDNSTDCETKDGKAGVCVLHYQCNPETGTVNTDGNSIIDIRQRECPHYLEVCCLLNQKQDKPPPPVVEQMECGWSNPGAQAFRIVNDGTSAEFGEYPWMVAILKEAPHCLEVCCLLNQKQDKPPPPVVEQTECGWSNPGAQAFRIVNDGTSAEFGEYPWMVAILKRSDSNTAWSQSDYMGGGSIIHPQVVLTGAHKVDGKEANEIKCRAGEWDTQTNKEIYPHQERNVKKIVKHAEYYRPSVYNSVALLILESPYALGNAPHIGVACLAPHAPPAGARCQSMGWGKEFNDKEKYAVVLKKVELPWVPRDKCQKELRKTRLGSHFVLHPSLTCAGGEAGKDTCGGDGGSSLVCPIGNVDPKQDSLRFAIYGMVAWGIGCGDAVPGVYVNVPQFYDWIGEKMAAEGLSTDSYTFKL
ncbi:phenoloxidase-activating factor 2-like [Cydia fagiglandana]|uniref:phenoloxidase-activating factor 2-like n=1 Tax=Cydia fagiglandana TaxID=1458189 RepID=UPI002FEE10F3